MAARGRLRQPGTPGNLPSLTDGRRALYHSASCTLLALPWHAGCLIAGMATSVIWHGTQTEALELLQALSRNCSCVVTAEGVRLSACPPHDMLSSDQRAVDGMLFARRIAPRLRAEEFEAAPQVAGVSS
jgi:hypothetical protein